MKTETYILPAYWASALVNNDYSGMEESEINELHKFIREVKSKGHSFYCLGCSDEQYFSWHNDSGNNLGGDVLEYTFDVSRL